MREGIQSTVAGLSLLTIDAVDGYENDPIRLCEDVINNNLVKKLASLIPIGYIFPMVMDGCVFSKPLQVRNGNVVLREDFEAALKEGHRAAKEVAGAGHRGVPRCCANP